jgi:hypothetical protein
VVCDDLSYLVERINRLAAAQGIPSKAELLSYVDRLFLEYGAKSEPSYSTLMRGNKFGLMDPSWELPCNSAVKRRLGSLMAWRSSSR